MVATSEWVHGKESGALRQLPNSDIHLKSETETQQMWDNVSRSFSAEPVCYHPLSESKPGFEGTQLTREEAQQATWWHLSVATQWVKNKAQRVAGDKKERETLHMVGGRCAHSALGTLEALNALIDNEKLHLHSSRLPPNHSFLPDSSSKFLASSYLITIATYIE